MTGSSMLISPTGSSRTWAWVRNEHPIRSTLQGESIRSQLSLHAATARSALYGHCTGATNSRQHVAVLGCAGEGNGASRLLMGPSSVQTCSRRVNWTAEHVRETDV